MTPAPQDSNERGECGKDDGYSKSAIIALELFFAAPMLAFMVFEPVTAIVAMMSALLVGYALWLVWQLF